MNVELVMLVVSLLFFVSIVVSKAGNRLGVPALLLFLCVGMVFGSDGLGIHFDNIETAQTIGTVALCIILFSGGMDTKIQDIRPVIAPGLVLEGLKLKHNLRPILELESGSNDPMAYVLTITFIQLVLHPSNPQYGMAVLTVLLQLAVGAAVGLLLGKLVVVTINRINIDNASLYPIIVLSACVFLFSATNFLHGNSCLAVYLGGLVVGNAKFVHKRSSRNFFEGLSWLCQLSILRNSRLMNPVSKKNDVF